VQLFTFAALFFLLVGHLSLVKLQFGPFQDVPVAPAGLSWPGRHLGQQTSGCELVVDGLFDGPVLLALGQFSLDVAGLLLSVSGSLVLVVVAAAALLDSDLDSVVLLVPRLEGVGVDDDDASLDEGLGPDEFVVGRVVHDVEDTDLPRADFRPPREVTGIQPEGPPLVVPSPAPDWNDLLLSDLRHGGRAAHHELALLALLRPASSRLAALVVSFACDTHFVVVMLLLLVYYSF
jgi:hypothetical protein